MVLGVAGSAHKHLPGSFAAIKEAFELESDGRCRHEQCVRRFVHREGCNSLFDFYSDDIGVSPAYHFYPITWIFSEVVICVRARQEPWDELVCLAYELFNCRNQNRFEELVDRAKAGTISRGRILLTRFLGWSSKRPLATRSLLRSVSLPANEKASHYFDVIYNCPTNFEDSLSYAPTVRHVADKVRNYQLQYDALRKRQLCD